MSSIPLSLPDSFRDGERSLCGPRIWILCLLVISSGCSVGYQPDGGSSSTDSPADAQPDSITVRNGQLGFDPAVVYERTESLMGANVPPPKEIVIADPDSRSTPEQQPLFYRAVGLTASAELPTDIGGRISPDGTIYLYVQDGQTSRIRTEQLLVHEFVHYIRAERAATARTGLNARNPDTAATRRSISEGTAVYLTEVYTEKHLPGGTSPVNRSARIYRNAEGVYRHYTAPYLFGARYVANRADSPNDLPTLYESPPRTTAEVMHQRPAGSDPAVRLDTDTTLRNWTRTGTRGPYGQMFIHAALGTELSPERATRGADGWGNDVQLRFRNERGTGIAWVIRWNDARNASEFNRAFTAFLQQRATETSGQWERKDVSYQLLQADRRTTVVLIGPEQFVTEAEVETRSGTVMIS